ncbi:hypothetical protein Clacol_003731 [Clathrus columnatus]|uniref:Small ribosomal subunit protein mS35 mitochondrial conserved domain-containing protein n=1 Tax=Clathrus columnatus TaxID=1419009 RepID=A0AAV5AA27_9AGAM|nr:hypothetical protein Clacol_003731 [Clathrus columnatus]
MASSFPRRDRQQKENNDDGMEEYDVNDIPLFDNDDATSVAHLIIEQEKQILNYLRLIERDRPFLRALRRPFVPPSPENPLVIRSISYAGEKHPVERKRVIVAPVSQLSLSSPTAIHKLKLLAGPRWFPHPPRDSGISPQQHEQYGAHGYIKLSCEDFPKASMNLKWGCDLINRLLQEANDTRETFADIPIDIRHVASRAKKYQKGEYIRPTIKDFPKEWLPDINATHT